MHHASKRFQAGLLAAVLAATLQFVLWAGALAGRFDAAPVAGIAAHCSVPGDPAGAPHQHNSLACLLCPVCLTASLPASLGAAAPLLLPPALLAVLVVQRPGGIRAPPAAWRATSFPRGPPLS